jgi:hypothetical protein
MKGKVHDTNSRNKDVESEKMKRKFLEATGCQVSIALMSDGISAA